MACGVSCTQIAGPLARRQLPNDRNPAMNTRPFLSLLLIAVCSWARADDADGSAPDLSRYEQDVVRLTAQIEQQPNETSHYSRRGDALFFLARFDEALADYDRMLELDPQLDASHWRRGIACFYAGKYEQAAQQFERYHSFDNVDRENGIWRYLSQIRAADRDRARRGLLKYEKDDREPFGDVYRLFAAQITPQQILDNITGAEIGDAEREKRLFYAHLYIGLNYGVEDHPEQALEHLKLAADNTWPAQAGYGPHYMWHVAQLHRDLLTKSQGDR